MSEFLCRKQTLLSQGNYHVMRSQCQLTLCPFPFQFFAAVFLSRDQGLEASPECAKVSE
jgi:hypothetical protein